MDCPQCGTGLTTYALQGHEALVCERCGYVGIEADHHGTSRQVESWDDALRRFYDEFGVDSDPHVPVRADAPTNGEADGSASGDRPDPRPAPDGVAAIRPRARGDEVAATDDDSADEAESSSDGGSTGGDDADEEVASDGGRGTDEDGSAVDDGSQSSVGES